MREADDEIEKEKSREKTVYSNRGRCGPRTWLRCEGGINENAITYAKMWQ